MADFNSADTGVTIQVGLGYDVSGAASVAFIATYTPPGGAVIRKSFTATVGNTTQTINGTSYPSGEWVYYVTAAATDFPQPGTWQGQVVPAWTGGDPNLSSAIFTMNVGARI